jgi:hypothetical protein
MYCFGATTRTALSWETVFVSDVSLPPALFF